MLNRSSSKSSNGGLNGLVVVSFFFSTFPMPNKSESSASSGGNGGTRSSRMFGFDVFSAVLVTGLISSTGGSNGALIFFGSAADGGDDFSGTGILTSSFGLMIGAVSAVNLDVVA